MSHVNGYFGVDREVRDKGFIQNRESINTAQIIF